MPSIQGPSGKKPPNKSPAVKPAAKAVVKKSPALQQQAKPAASKPAIKPVVKNAANNTPAVKTLPAPSATRLASDKASGLPSGASKPIQAQSQVQPLVKATEKVPAALQSRMTALEENVRTVSPAIQNYTQVFGGIAEGNYAQLDQMGRGFAAAQDAQAGKGSPFSAFEPVTRSRLSPEKQEWMQASSTELTRQLRQDLREGRTPAFLSPEQFANIQSPQEAIAMMRFNQGLQQAGIPQNFEGRSPQDRAELTAHIAVGGIVPALPNAPEALTQYRQLLTEQNEINQQREKLGMSPVQNPALSAMQTRLNGLDQQLATYGREHVRQFGGNPSETQLPFQSGDAVESRSGPSSQLEDLHRQSLEQQIQNRPPGKPFSDSERMALQDRFNIVNNGLHASLRAPLTDALQDEMIRVNDSVNLLKGNQSGLSIKDVPMSQSLRNALGLNLPDAPPAVLTPFLNQDAQIDRIALLPENQRLDAVKRAALGIRADAANATESTQAIGNKYDSLLLSRISDDGQLQDVQTKLSKTLQAGADEMGVMAVQASSIGSHQLALSSLRSARGHQQAQNQTNEQFERLTQETQLRGLMMVQDTALGLVSAFGPSAARSLGQGAMRQSVSQPLRQELQGMSREAIRELAEKEVSSLARQQFSNMTTADLRSLTQQHYRNLLQQVDVNPAIGTVSTPGANSVSTPVSTPVSSPVSNPGVLPDVPPQTPTPVSSSVSSSVTPSSASPASGERFYFQSHFQSVGDKVKRLMGVQPEGTPLGQMMTKQEVNTLNQMIRPTQPRFQGNNNQLFEVKLPGNNEETLLRIPKDFASDLTGGPTRILSAERVPISYPPEMQRFLPQGSFPDEMIIARSSHATEALTSHPKMPNVNPVVQSGSPITTV
jgi:hypothetical protein